MKKFLIVIEQGEENFGAHCPDLPGCVAVGDTREETKRNMIEAIKLHLRGMIEDGESLPDPKADAEFVEVPFSRTGSD